ncbi:MAG: hypothetical protein EOM12_17100 [Verrucomicrobiae bacterium]|nr:hypothetical protein [Verrucomicrobiae bacterium]
MNTPKEHSLNDYVDLLEDINSQLASRTEKIPADVQALLTQKNAIIQQAFQEMGQILRASAGYLDEYSVLKKKCHRWRDTFLVPLLEQSNNPQIELKVDTEDLTDIIRDISGYLTD